MTISINKKNLCFRIIFFSNSNFLLILFFEFIFQIFFLKSKIIYETIFLKKKLKSLSIYLYIYYNLKLHIPKTIFYTSTLNSKFILVNRENHQNNLQL